MTSGHFANLAKFDFTETFQKLLASNQNPQVTRNLPGRLSG
jgi:hypothetical protein